jgi:anti-sigma B factor antagonist
VTEHVAIRAAPQAGGGVRLVVEGELDLAGAPMLDEALERALGEGHDDIAVDLAGTTLLDSTGLGALIRAARTVRERGGRIAVHAPRGSDARLVIGISGTGSVVGLVE